MTTCSNCYTGCTDIISDKCIKYTGIDIPLLGIQNGDSLSYVEQALIGFLSSTLDGTGIKPDIDPDIMCSLVQGYLPDCGDITIVDLISALIQAACDLQEQVDDVTGDMTTLNAPYTISCLTGVTADSDTHLIIQTVITKLCSVDTSLTALALNVATNYVALADLNNLIAAYLASVAPGTAIKNKMVPYTAVEYYGPLTYFDITGAGEDDWAEIYLCNGNNGTPDKRGRTSVGTTTGMGGPAFNAAVDPAIPGNPNYSLLSTGGVNNTLLSVSQIPLHTHTATAAVTDTGHYHFEFSNIDTNEGLISASTYPEKAFREGTNSQNYTIRGADIAPTLGKSSLSSTGITVAVTNASTGSNPASHSNIQPVLACHYIMYIPS